MPFIPLHFFLMRGRVADDRTPGITDPEPGKSSTPATAVGLKVFPVEQRMHEALDHPTKARPGETAAVAIALADHRPPGRPCPARLLCGRPVKTPAQTAPERPSVGKRKRISPGRA